MENYSRILRGRFINAFPASVVALAYSPSLSQLALAREDGSISLFDSRSWASLDTIHGYKKQYFPICKLHWYGPELLTTSLAGHILVWDQRSKSAARTVSTSGIWDSELVDNQLILACEDGSVRAATLPELELSFYSTPQPSRALSVAAIETGGHIRVFSGHSDGSLVRWTLGRKAPEVIVQGKSAVLQVLALSAGEVACGDKAGFVSIWDMEVSVRKVALKTHKGPILAMRAAEARDTIYATGCDSLLVAVQKEEEHWKVQNSERGQSHDVLALEVVDKRTLVSGGITTDLCIHALTESGHFHQQYGSKQKQTYRHLIDLGSKLSVSEALSGDIFFLENQLSRLQLYRVSKLRASCATLLGSFQFEGDQNTRLADLMAVDQHALFIAAAEISTLRIIRFDVEESKAELMLEVRESLSFLQFGVQKLYTLSHDGDCKAYALSLYRTIVPPKPRALKYASGGGGKDPAQIWRVAIFEEEDKIAILNNQKEIYVHSLMGGKAASPGVMKIPLPSGSLPSEIALLQESRVAVVYSSNRIDLFDTESGNLEPWSVENEVPKSVLSWHNKVRGVVGLSYHKALFYSSHGFFTLAFDETMPKSGSMYRRTFKKKAERQDHRLGRGDEKDQWFALTKSTEKEEDKAGKPAAPDTLKSGDIVTQNFGILGVFGLSGERVLVMEVDYSEMVRRLPPALRIKKYGK